MGYPCILYSSINNVFIVGLCYSYGINKGDNNKLNKNEYEQEIKRLKEENKKLTEQLNEQRSDGWDFHWDGRGSYEESRRCFYGDFS